MAHQNKAATILGTVLLLIATSASSNVLYGDGDLPFNNGDWTITGNASINSYRISMPSNFSSNNSHVEATVNLEGNSEGIIVDVIFDGWTSSRSMAIIDNTGQTRLYIWMTNGQIRATALGQTVGEIPYGFGDRLRVTFTAPASRDSQYQWYARIENIQNGSFAEYQEPGTTPMLFQGPITAHLIFGYGVGGYIDRVVVNCEDAVSTDTSTFGSLKSLYR